MASSCARARVDTASGPQKRAAATASTRARGLDIAGHPSLADLPRQGARRARSEDAEPPELIHGLRESVLEEAVLPPLGLSALDLHVPGPALLAIEETNRVGTWRQRDAATDPLDVSDELAIHVELSPGLRLD